MGQRVRQRIRQWAQHWILRSSLVAVLVAVLVTLNGAIAPAAQAYNNPDLLPDEPIAVVDLANSIPDGQERSLVEKLDAFEAETGWKLRVLTQFDRTPGRAVLDFWGLDNKSLLLIADARGGNLLNFNVGDAFYELMPRTFWIELQTRYGNQFFVRDNGENQAIVESLESVMGCVSRGGCQFVPGLPQEQWILTLITSIVGGVICGFAAHPRKEDQAIAWQWALILSPLWGILFVAFGIAPVISRTDDWVPLVRNISGFAIGALVAFLTPVFGPPKPSKS